MFKQLLRRTINLTSAGRVVSSIKGTTLLRCYWSVLLEIATGLVLLKDVWDVFDAIPYPVLVAAAQAYCGSLYSMGHLGVF